MSGRTEARSGPTSADAPAPAPPVGILLKSYRERVGLTQQDLAGRSGVSLAAIRDLEQGRSRRPRRDSVRGLARALELNAQDEARLFAAAFAMRPTAVPAPTRPTETDPAAPATPTRLGVLGPLTVWRGGGAVPLTARQKVVVLRLALSAGDVVGREELMDLLWGGRRPASAKNSLHTCIARLRALLQPEPTPVRMLSTTGGGYRLVVGPDQLDLLRFRELAARGAGEEDPERALGHYAEAARLWRGHPDVDLLSSSPLMTAVIEEYAALLCGYATVARDGGEGEQVLPRLRDLAGRLELHEPLHAELVITLSATGRQAEALAAYQRVRAALGDQLGMDPGDQLRAAHQGVLQQRWRGTPRASGRTVIQQAPAAPPDFVGRGRELAVVAEALGLGRSAAGLVPPARIVAVNGPAGIGKTALALEAARRLRDDFPDGQLYADLRGVSTDPVAPLEVLGRFLRALGVPAQRVGADEAEAGAMLRSELAGRRMLVILDNARDTRQVSPLLPGAGECVVLLTSRRRLPDLAGATVVDLPTLPVADALDLLAAAVGPHRIIADPRSARQLAAACGQLPLALRIAGARLTSRPSWSTADLVERLRDTNRRLTELSVGEVGVLASFRLSYHDLSDSARRAFRVCALHPGDDFGLEAAAVLLDVDPVEADLVLGELLDANMLLQYAADRFRFHDLLGLYAARLLAEDDRAERAAARDRLHTWYLRGATAALEWVYPQLVRRTSHGDRGAVFDGPDDAFEWLDTEAPALVSLVERTADSDHRRLAWQIADQLRGYFLVRRHVDRWLRTADAGLRAAVAEGDPAAQAAMLISRGQAMWALGRHPEALDAYTEGARLADAGGWRPAVAYLRHNIGLVLAEQGRLDEAEQSYQAALALSADDDLGHVRAVTLNGLGVMCADQGRLSAAAEYFGAALRINQVTGRDTSVLANRLNLGMVLRQLGAESTAEEHLCAARDGYRRLADPHGELSCLDELSQLHTQRGEGAAAVGAAQQGYDLALIVRNQRAQAALLTTMGEAHLGGGDVPAALESFRQALRVAADYPYFATRATVGLAESLRQVGDGADAHRHAERAEEAARAHGFRMVEAGALEVRARCVAGDDPALARRLAAGAADTYRTAGADLLAGRVEAEQLGRPR
ncbi:BTAD domain-containing putative transcriptional regulator [Micromonospora sp. WMMD1102]|uniref:BTAD domain-containing putative transcriptional regulator n=1 Tax=Micromonospora sp. WMMD1102 TaxID=3016105 RepID=UPI0024152DAF|nr:BTAD domain-containing putative transcriptional regulator [Micromonospora sp. WMMD1102]MDG4790261.1 BTAD domain-containing putative transcriptional regulator [Micromonospora sp. WMMD1102]